MKPETREITMLGLPIPPSVNRIYKRRRDGGLYLSPEAKTFKQLVWAKWTALGKPRIIGWYTVEVILPGKARGDDDNYLKIPIDALKECCATQDDKFCRSPFARKDLGLSETMVVVRAVSADWVRK
jgi:Holliday junction resolvase RusA-like endonuclease